MISLPGIRSDSAPAIGAMNIGASVQGRILRPDSERRVALHGLKELREQEDRAEHAEVHEQRGRVRQRERGVAEEPHRQHRVVGPQLPGDERGHEHARRPPASRRSRGSPSPGRCRGRGPRRSRTGRRSRARAPAGRAGQRGPYVSVSCRSASGISSSPIGTFSQKIHCQLMPSTTAPPTSGPNATARPEMPPQAPSASPRCSGGTAALRIVSVSGITIAPPRPCTARAALSSSTRRRERRGDRAEREDRDADREDPAAAEAVAERRAGRAGARRTSACTR